MHDSAPDVSSIGPQWPPRPTSHGRVKGIDNRGAIEDAARLDSFLDELETTWSDLVDPGDPDERGRRPSSRPCDRLSVRALVADSLLATERLAPWVEALLPLDGAGRRLADLSLVYLGRNAAGRATDARDVKRSLDHLRIARERESRSAASVIARAREGGYALHVLSRDERLHDAKILAGVARLYERFGWNAEEVRSILAARDSLIAIARERGGAIVSAGIAEMSHVSFGDGRDLRIAEFTEAATLDSHRGQGLYSGLCATLMGELAELSKRRELLGGALDLAFGECSGQDLGILIAAKCLGRTFSRHVIRERGLPFEGFLPQHVPIAGAERATRYNDLFPTFISRADLYAFVES